MYWSLSLHLLLQKRQGLSKKIWTHEGPSIQKKIEHVKVEEKRKQKKEKKER